MAKKSPGNTPPNDPSLAGAPRELIVITKSEAAVRARPASLESASGADVSGLSKILKTAGGKLTPLFGASEERLLRATASIASRATELAAAPDLSTYYRVNAADDTLDDVAQELLQNDAVEAAFVKPGAEPPVINDAQPASEEAPPVTPDFSLRQGYLDPAPGGINARFAWTKTGGGGNGIRIIDIEGAWRFTHEDLTQNQGGVVGGTQSADIVWRNHGTAVIGEFGGDRNAIGITGIVPEANVRAISIFGPGSGSAFAIRRAADLLSPGDVILIELHRPGPRFAFAGRADQRGYIAVEWWPDDFAAIRYAIGRGVIVVEAAGNGGENLDDAIYSVRPAGFPATWANPFRRAPADSGAIVVGAGAPPPGTHGRDHGPDRSRLGFSNWGALIDAQGWGREVTTAGYGDLQGGTNEDFWYTDTFSGTSSASPIVVGAIASLQGALRGGGKPLQTPAQMRALLRSTGSPQQASPASPLSQRIGNRPDLRGLIERFYPKPVKEFIKEKEIRKDVIKEKETRKDLIKDKELQKDLIKDKDFKEGKELKEGKEFKEGKELKEKDIFEGGGGLGGIRVNPAVSTPLDDRMAALEQQVATLSHFISAELRPDLASSALRQEPDQAALSAELQQQAANAKYAKDQKDVEKGAEAY